MGVFGLMTLLAGCSSVGPNYRPAQAQVPVAWPRSAATVAMPGTYATQFNPSTTAASGNVTTVSTTSVSSPSETICTTGTPSENLLQWWTVFNDPILNQLIDDALTCNLDLQQAQLRIYAARESKGIVEGKWFPQINGNAAALKERASGESSAKRPNGTVNFFKHGLDAAWELDFFGGTRRAIESEGAKVEASIEDRRAVLVTVVSEVGANYISLRGYQKELAIARDNVDSQSKSLDLTDKKFKAGISNALDVANATALVAGTRAQIPQLETAAQNAIYTISVLLGKEPAALDELLSKPSPIPTPPNAIPLGLPSDLLCRRPDVRRAQALIHAATAQIGVAKSDFFPKFSLTGQFGLQGGKPSSLFNVARRFYNFGPTIDWPVFAGGRINCNYLLQQTLTEQATVAYRQTVLTALQEVDSSIFAFAKEKEHRDALSDAVKAYQQVVSLSLKLYTDGSTDFLNVITAQRSLYQAQDELAQSERNLSVNVVAVYKALGGGWDNADVIDCKPCVRLIDAFSAFQPSNP
ncbi:MAG: efflux transporter outer membrane subunit [Planctomycetota bacterium]